MESPSPADSSAKLKSVRTQTEAPFLECRKALEATGWDVDRAVRLIRSRLWQDMPKLINPVRGDDQPRQNR